MCKTIMTPSEVINKILYEYRINANQFALSINVAPAQIYDIRSGKIKRISEDIASKILNKYSNLNRTWLISGEGEMYLEQPNKNLNISSVDVTSLQVLVSEMSAQREMSDRHITRAFDIIKHFQEQTDRMITLLENYK